MFDVVVRHGTIVDGSGEPAFEGDVGIVDGRIAAVERELSGDAAEVIDASGRVVAPGFVDPHTHVDAQFFWDPFALPLVLHGVTSALTGNCAVTLAPVRSETVDALAHVFNQVEEVPLDTLRGLPWSWSSFGEYAEQLRPNLGINCGALVGHCAIRLAVMGPEAALDGAATPAEIEQMREVLRQSLRAGAIGFSTSQNRLHVGEGGVPIPSRVATEDEIAALCAVVGEEGVGIIQTDGGVDVAHRAEWIRTVGGPIARSTGRTVLAGNVLAQYDGSDAIIEAVAAERADGATIIVQANPVGVEVFFTLDGSSILFTALPHWAKFAELSHAEQLDALRRPDLRATLEAESHHERDGLRWDVVRVHAVMDPAHKALEGKSIVEIAAARGVDPATAAIDLALDEDLATQFVRGSTSPDERTEAYLSSPHAIIGSSDAGAHITTFCGGANTSVFLAKWVRERKLMSIEAAVRRLTSEPAAVLGFRNRGWLREGYAADVVVFDPDTIDCGPARYVDDLPGGGHRVWHDAEGVDHVMVNGRVVVRDRELTGAVAGELIPPS